jgi:hypothetical protein
MNKLSLGAAGLALLAPLAAMAGPVLSILPAAQSAGYNETITVSVVISGLNSVSPREIVSAFDLDVLYDTMLLQQVGAAAFAATTELGGPALAFFDTLGTAAGRATGNAFSLASDAALVALQGDSFTLFSYQFLTGTTDAAARFDFGPSLDFERLVVGRNGLAMQLSYAGACVAIGNANCVVEVPEPSSFGLAAIALLAAGGAGRTLRRRASDVPAA